MPAAWDTAPFTWTAGLLATAARMNEEIRDRLLYLFTRPGGNAELTGDITTTSTSFTTATGMSITITTKGGRVKLDASMTCHQNGANNNFFSFSTDGGTQYGDATNGITATQTGPTAASPMNVGLSYMTPALAAGSHTFTVVWRVSAGTGTLRDGSQFAALEV